MILNLYSLKNRLSGIYERPVAENCEVKDYIESLARTLASQPVDSLNFYKEFDAYFVGTFDTKSAIIILLTSRFKNNLFLDIIVILIKTILLGSINSGCKRAESF